MEDEFSVERLRSLSQFIQQFAQNRRDKVLCDVEIRLTGDTGHDHLKNTIDLDLPPQENPEVASNQEDAWEVRIPEEDAQVETVLQDLESTGQEQEDEPKDKIPENETTVKIPEATPADQEKEQQEEAAVDKIPEKDSEDKIPEENSEFKTPLNSPEAKIQGNPSETETSQDPPEVSVPQNEDPEVKISETEVPEVKIPETEVPEVKIPETEVPEVKIPETEVPEVKTPEEDLADQVAEVAMEVSVSDHETIESIENFIAQATSCPPPSNDMEVMETVQVTDSADVSTESSTNNDEEIPLAILTTPVDNGPEAMDSDDVKVPEDHQAVNEDEKQSGEIVMENKVSEENPAENEDQDILKQEEAGDEKMVEEPEPTIHAHRIILANSSPVLKRRLQDLPSDEILTIDGISRDTFEFLLDYMYTRSIGPIDESRMFQIFAGGKLLGLTEVEAECSALILRSQSVQNCLRIWIFGYEKDCETGLKCPKFIFQNFAQVSTTQDFLNLTFEQLKWLVSSPERTMTSCPPNSLLLSFHKWACHPDGPQRVKQFVELVRDLPIDELDHEMMGQIFEDSPLIAGDIDCGVFFNAYCRNFFARHRQTLFSAQPQSTMETTKKSSSKRKRENGYKNRENSPPSPSPLFDSPAPLDSSTSSSPGPMNQDLEKTNRVDHTFDGSHDNGKRNGTSGGQRRRRHSSKEKAPLVNRPGPKSKKMKMSEPPVDRSRASSTSSSVHHLSDHARSPSVDERVKTVDLLSEEETPEVASCVAYFIVNNRDEHRHQREQIWSYDLDTKKTKVQISFESGEFMRHRCEMLYADQKIFFIGGKDKGAFVESVGGEFGRTEIECGSVAILDLTCNPPQFQMDDLPSLRRERCDFHGCIFQNKIYVAGGCNGEEVLRSVEMLSLDDLSRGWEMAPHMRCYKDNAAIALLKGKIYSVGGLLSPNESKGPVASRIVECYAPKSQSQKWKDISAMRQARLGAAVAVLESNLFVLGGGTTYCAPFGKMADVEVFNADTKKWTKGKPMLKARQFFSAVAYKGKIYAIGGDNPRKPTMERYDPTRQKWELVDKNLPAHGDYRSVAFALSDDQ